MKLCYVIPDDQYSFFRELVEPLRAAGIDVRVNELYPDTDLILAAILPITHEWADRITESRKPFVLWHWDLYTFTDYREPRWRTFLAMLHVADDVWSCTYETARELRQIVGLHSYVVPAWVRDVYDPAARAKDFAFYAASSGGFGKRVDWARRACELMNVPLKLTTNQRESRRQYEKDLNGCKFYLMTAFEESNGTIPAMEAAVCAKPVVAADLPATREVFNDTVTYFPPNDFGALLSAIGAAMKQKQNYDARERMLNQYRLQEVAARVAGRLRDVHAGVQGRLG